MKRSLAIVGLVAVAAAIGFFKWQGQGGAEMRNLNIYLQRTKLNLDPHQMATANSMTIVVQLHRGLLRFDSNGDCVPDLAESWTESPDHLVYRFKLREAYFSNGERITSLHVQHSFARAFFLGAGIAADIDYIAGVKEFLRTKNIDDFGVKVISDDIVEFRLAHASSLFLKQMAIADCAVMPFSSVAELAQSPKAFSGPYKIVGPAPTGGYLPDAVELVKWRKDHLESSASPERIVFFNSEAPLVELALMGENDSLDAIAVAPEARAKLEARGWGAAPTELTQERFIVLNPNRLSLELRQFLYSRANPDDLIRFLAEPGYKPAYGVIPDGFPGLLTRDDVADRWQAANYTGPKVKFQFDYNEGNPFDQKMVDYLRGAWKHARIEIDFKAMPPAERLERYLERKLDAVLAKKSIDYPDGYSVLTYFKGKYEANVFFVDDPAIDAAISATIREFDVGRRAEAYKKVQQQILRFRTVIPLVFGSSASGLWSQKVRNAPSHPMGLHTMPFETIEMRL